MATQQELIEAENNLRNLGLLNNQGSSQPNLGLQSNLGLLPARNPMEASLQNSLTAPGGVFSTPGGAFSQTSPKKRGVGGFFRDAIGLALNPNFVENRKMRELIDSQNVPQGEKDFLNLLSRDQKIEYLTDKLTGKNKGKNTADITNYEFFKSLPKADQYDYLISSGQKNADIVNDLRIAASPSGLDLSPGQRALDAKFATTAESWLSQDSVQVDANIMNLEEKLSIIERGEIDVSGKFIGITPEFLQPFVGQEAARAFLGDVRDIVFQSLKKKLGAQFTEKEGDRLVAAAYDSSLPEEVNAKRLRRLLSVVKTMKDSTDRMVQYWNQTGTLKGYEQPVATFNNIYDALVEEEFASKTTEELTNIYANTKDLDKKTAILRYAEKLAEQGK